MGISIIIIIAIILAVIACATLGSSIAEAKQNVRELNSKIKEDYVKKSDLEFFMRTMNRKISFSTDYSLSDFMPMLNRAPRISTIDFLKDPVSAEMHNDMMGKVNDAYDRANLEFQQRMSRALAATERQADQATEALNLIMGHLGIEIVDVPAQTKVVAKSKK